MPLQIGIYKELILFCLYPTFCEETGLLTVTFRLLLLLKLGEARDGFEQIIRVFAWTQRPHAHQIDLRQL